jgi:hypothetical protein
MAFIMIKCACGVPDNFHSHHTKKSLQKSHFVVVSCRPLVKWRLPHCGRRQPAEGKREREWWKKDGTKWMRPKYGNYKLLALLFLLSQICPSILSASSSQQ